MGNTKKKNSSIETSNKRCFGRNVPLSSKILCIKFDAERLDQRSSFLLTLILVFGGLVGGGFVGGHFEFFGQKHYLD